MFDCEFHTTQNSDTYLSQIMATLYLNASYSAALWFWVVIPELVWFSSQLLEGGYDILHYAGMGQFHKYCPNIQQLLNKEKS